MRFVLILSCILNSLYISPAFATSSDYDRLFLQARMHEKQQNVGAATQIYQRLIKTEPGRPEAYNNLANILVTNNDLAAAQALLEKAMQTNPIYATIYDNLSRLYVEMARDSYGKALRLQTGESQFALTELDQPISLAAELNSNGPVQTTQIRLKQSAEQQNKAVNLALSPKKSLKNEESGLQAQDKADIMTTLEGWAAAWSEQASDVYFVFYDENYHPPGISRKIWEKQRRIKLKRPNWIRVGLKNMEIKPLNNKEAQVKLIQEYRASNYQDTTRKEFRLRQTHDGWRIVAERSIARIN